jgi:hypothetical protein
MQVGRASKDRHGASGPDKVQRIIQAAGEEAKISLDAITRVEEEIQRFTNGFPDAGEEALWELAEDTILEFKRNMLAWEQLELDEKSDNNAESGTEDGPTGEELLQVLEGILTSEMAAKVPKEEPVETDWPQEVFLQAIYVSCIAAKSRKDVTKADWDTDCHVKYRELLEKESV